MDRRGFLSLLGLGIAGVAFDQAIPLGRVWSFPKQIVVPEFPPRGNIFLAPTWITRECLEKFKRNLVIAELESDSIYRDFHRRFAVGSKLRVRFPPRYTNELLTPARRPACHRSTS